MKGREHQLPQGKKGANMKSICVRAKLYGFTALYSVQFLLFLTWVVVTVKLSFVVHEGVDTATKNQEMGLVFRSLLNRSDHFHSNCEELIHSKKWLVNKKLSNNIDGYDSSLVGSLMDPNPLAHFPVLAEQTICLEEGSFRDNRWDVPKDQLVHSWYTRLVYLALHDFFHQPARQELKMRASFCSKEAMLSLPQYEFECQDTKFLVTSIPSMGMGASFRLGAIGHIIVSIASGRIPLFFSKTPKGTPKWMQAQWPLVSCSRGDYQCVFQPLSPCTLLLEDLRNGTRLSESEARILRKTGSLSPQHEGDRVLIVPSTVQGVKGTQKDGPHPALRERLHEHAKKIVDTWAENYRMMGGIAEDSVFEMKLDILQEALNRISKTDDLDPHQHFGYSYRHYRLPHIILMYIMRPNKNTKNAINKQAEESIPEDIPDKTLPVIGLPIRGKSMKRELLDSDEGKPLLIASYNKLQNPGSDKCERESTCLNFSQYMRLAEELWEESQEGSVFRAQRGKIIMTTEDPTLMSKRHLYNKSSGFPLDFVVNEHDPLQGSGNTRVFKASADKILTSSMAAMTMQFHASIVVGNCCSNFHIMMFDFLREGCGLTKTFKCLQETKKYNLCCEWTSSPHCDALEGKQIIS